MSMERSTQTFSYAVLDENGNGVEVTFKQIGATEKQLVAVQGNVVMPSMQKLVETYAAFLGGAAEKIK